MVLAMHPNPVHLLAGRSKVVHMNTIRRIIVGLTWIIGAFVGLAFAADGLLQSLRYIGLDLQAEGTTAISMASAILIVLASISVGVLAYRGRLPGTGPAKPVQPATSARTGWSRILGTVGLALGTAAVAAIVSAAISTAYGAGVYEQRVQAGDIDGIVTIYSEILRESRDLRVQLPSDYNADPTRRYPVLLVLDAGWQQTHTTRTAKVLSRLDLAEPMIVVGVVNGLAGRNVDFVQPGVSWGAGQGRADRFLEFLEKEVLAEIDNRFRTNSTHLLAGHSLGGLFVTYSLIENPELFAGRFAFSPSWWVGDQAILPELQQFLVDSPDLNSFFYTSLGALESGGMHGAFEVGVASLTRDAPEALRWKADITDGADHGINAEWSTPTALRAFWDSSEQ